MDLQLSINVGQLVLAAMGGATLWMVSRLMKQIDNATEVTQKEFPVLRAEVERNTADVKTLYKRTDQHAERVTALEQK